MMMIKNIFPIDGSSKKKIFIKYEKRKTNYFHYVGYMYLLDDVDVCLSIYSIIIELIDSIEKEKKNEETSVTYHHIDILYIK